ncbi:MAG: hypothetical protein H7144_09000 [Burkholderiales bacterium]|nr:hypothetical protein [Phycisphaerae bacterium]
MTRHIPQTIEPWVADYIKCWRRERATRMVCALLSGAIGITLVMATIDRALALPLAARWGLFGLVLAALAAAVGVALWSWFPVRYDKLRAAARVEASMPMLEGRLATLTVQQTYSLETRASRGLLDELRKEIELILRARSPGRCVDHRGAHLAIVGLLGVVFLTIGLMTIPVYGLPSLLARQLAPWKNSTPVTTTRLTVITGAVKVRQGSPLAIVADVVRVRGAVELLVGTNVNELQPVTMTPVTEGRYAVTLPRVERDLIYRVRCGGALSEIFGIRVDLSPPDPQIEPAQLVAPSFEDPAVIYARTLPTLPSPNTKP